MVAICLRVNVLSKGTIQKAQVMSGRQWVTLCPPVKFRHTCGNSDEQIRGLSIYNYTVEMRGRNLKYKN